MSEFDEVEYERSHPRETVRTKATVMLDGKSHTCVLTNISPAGTRLYTRMSASRDQALSLKVGEFGEYGEFKATVAWCYADEIGLQFEDDLTALADELVKLI